MGFQVQGNERYTRIRITIRFWGRLSRNNLFLSNLEWSLMVKSEALWKYHYFQDGVHNINTMWPLVVLTIQKGICYVKMLTFCMTISWINERWLDMITFIWMPFTGWMYLLFILHVWHVMTFFTCRLNTHAVWKEINISDSESWKLVRWLFKWVIS